MKALQGLSAETFLALTQLYADYASTLDAARWDDWPGFFTEDCLYEVQPRENHERGFPLATMSFESRGMLKDRAFAVRETLFHDPYYQRHVVGVPLVRRLEAHPSGDRIHCEANYAVFRTKLSELSTVYSVGRTLDEVVLTPEGLKFAVRRVIYDSEMIPNSLIYPL